MLPWITHHVRHPRFLPSSIDFFVAFPAGRRPHIMGRGHRSGLDGGCRLRRKCSDFWQMADEGDELPCLAVRHLPGWHARIPDAVANVIEDLSVGHRGDALGEWRRLP